MYFLDGESILETTLSYLRLLSPRMKGRILQLCLLAGTIFSVFAFLRIFLATILQAWGWYIIPSFLIFLSVLYFTSFTYCAILFIFCFNIDHAAMCDTGGVSLSRKPHDACIADAMNNSPLSFSSDQWGVPLIYSVIFLQITFSD